MESEESTKDFKNKEIVKNTKGITLIAFAISRKCVRYEERA